MAAEAAGAKPNPGILEQLQKLIERFGLITAGLVAIGGSAAALWKYTQPEIRVAVLGLAGLALTFILVGQFVLPWLDRRRKQGVIATSETKLRAPTTFRLRPYDQDEHDTYDRPDQAHHAALRWLQRADAPFLYLTGVSGTGKSSLLQAWLKPELAKADPPTLVLVVRSYGDPIAQLTDALIREGVRPDERGSEDPRALLERAAAAVRPGRLVIAIDQFEECLILQDDQGRAQLAALFRALAEEPVEGLSFLLALRTDYLHFDELRSLGLPAVRADRNWFNLDPLTRGQAGEILDAGVTLDPALRETVLDEAGQIDDQPGLVRPIKLNMLGMVLDRFSGGALQRATPGRLIHDYLRQAMARPGIDDIAPKMLGEMITEQGTKRPMDEAALAGATGIAPGLLQKALLFLGRDGVVRELDPERRVWEVSHDFVARQLGQILPRLRPSRLRRAQATLAPVALVAWLVLLPLLAFAGPELMERYARNTLSEAGVRVPWRDDLDGYSVGFDKGSGRFERLKAWMPWIHPIRSVQIVDNDTEGVSFDGLEGLGALTSLSIHGNRDLQAIDGLDKLGALTSLTIYGNDALQAIDGLDELKSLEELKIEGSFLPAMLDKVASLPALERLLLPFNLEGTRLDRPKALPPVEIRFDGVDMDWWDEWR